MFEGTLNKSQFPELKISIRKQKSSVGSFKAGNGVSMVVLEEGGTKVEGKRSPKGVCQEGTHNILLSNCGVWGSERWRSSG